MCGSLVYLDYHFYKEPVTRTDTSEAIPAVNFRTVTPEGSSRPLIAVGKGFLLNNNKRERTMVNIGSKNMVGNSAYTSKAL